MTLRCVANVTEVILLTHRVINIELGVYLTVNIYRDRTYSVLTLCFLQYKYKFWAIVQLYFRFIQTEITMQTSGKNSFKKILH